jgi:TPR repeat protein
VNSTISPSSLSYFQSGTDNPLEQYYLACFFEHDGSYKKAVALFQQSASAGAYISKLRLAGLLFEGVHIEQDFANAFLMYQEVGLKAGSAFALTRAANLMAAGLGGQKDSVLATEYFKKAIEKGYAPAYYYLALFKITESPKTAETREAIISNLTKAIELGFEDARLALAKYRVANPLDKSEKAIAFNELLQLAKEDNKEAQRLVGEFYYFGELVEKNNDIAIHWLTQAAESNDYEAYAFLGLAYTRKIDSPVSATIAENWFLKASESNDNKHKLMLANFYISYSEVIPSYVGLGEGIKSELAIE